MPNLFKKVLECGIFTSRKSRLSNSLQKTPGHTTLRDDRSARRHELLPHSGPFLNKLANAFAAQNDARNIQVGIEQHHVGNLARIEAAALVEHANCARRVFRRSAHSHLER